MIESFVNALTPLKFASGTSIVSLVAFPPSIQGSIAFDPTGFVITNNSRYIRSVVIDKNAHKLLDYFWSNITIDQALTAYAAVSNTRPSDFFDKEARRLITRLVWLGHLEKVGCPKAFVQENIVVGSRIGVWIITKIIQLSSQASIFQVQRGSEQAILKLASNRNGESVSNKLILREQSTYCALPAGIAPKLIESGSFDGRSFLILRYLEGSDALRSTRTIHGEPVDGLRLAKGVLNVFAQLEKCEYLHGDVHPRNVIVTKDGRPWLIDFAYSKKREDPERYIAGNPFFMPPEIAKSQLSNTSPIYDSLSEQYSLASLIYLIISRTHRIKLLLNRPDFLRQVAANIVLPFQSRTISHKVESVLNVALSTTPCNRFNSINEFMREFDKATCVPVVAQVPPKQLMSDLLTRETNFLSRCFSAIALPAGPLKTLANANFHNGFAGFSFALYRIALLTENPKLLAASDILITQAEHFCMRNSSKGGDLAPAEFSLHYSAGGVHVTAILIALARRDRRQVLKSIEYLIKSFPVSWSHTGVVKGAAGALLGLSLILAEDLSIIDAEVKAELIAKGNEIFFFLVAQLRGSTAVGLEGIAHGSAGVIYSQLRWVSIIDKDSRFNPIEYLAAIREFIDRVPFNNILGELSSSPEGAFSRASWCNGASGYVHLFCLAGRVLKDPAFQQMAVVLGDIVFKDQCKTVCLCCGLGGRVHAMLCLARATNDNRWLTRAKLMIKKNPAIPLRNASSLYKGEMGMMLLNLQIENPRHARMPMFE